VHFLFGRLDEEANRLSRQIYNQARIKIGGSSDSRTKTLTIWQKELKTPLVRSDLVLFAYWEERTRSVFQVPSVTPNTVVSNI